MYLKYLQYGKVMQNGQLNVNQAKEEAEMEWR